MRRIATFLICMLAVSSALGATLNDGTPASDQYSWRPLRTVTTDDTPLTTSTKAWSTVGDSSIFVPIPRNWTWMAVSAYAYGDGDGTGDPDGGSFTYTILGARNKASAKIVATGTMTAGSLRMSHLPAAPHTAISTASHYGWIEGPPTCTGYWPSGVAVAGTTDDQGIVSFSTDGLYGVAVEVTSMTSITNVSIVYTGGIDNTAILAATSDEGLGTLDTTLSAGITTLNTGLTNSAKARTGRYNWVSARTVSSNDTVPDPNGMTWTAAGTYGVDIEETENTISLGFYAYYSAGDPNAGTFDANVYLVEEYGGWERIASISVAVGEMELTHNPVTGAALNGGSLPANESYKWCEGTFTDNLSDSDAWPTTVNLSGVTNGVGKLNVDPLGAKKLVVLIDNKSATITHVAILKKGR